ncbi:molybdate transport system ATP-binding protein [Muriicola jejuensis]|uniref:ATP-binding cassette domain-containing protein n=2 Tax=Muriicola jejuensis TaxID=504488 RepID=A0A6P0UBM8_9FLAO|nr:ATP-binding cassette domain-containing protein [Muriicola jejuensis]SMP17566.1 molybdate transport system ATP-binding protein [Muriicola jejuensis]
MPSGFEELEHKKGALFSTSEILRWMEEELRHDRKVLARETEQSLQSMSSGERKKALFRYLMEQQPEYLILDNAFDNLDRGSRDDLVGKITVLADSTSLIQILSRRSDLLPFIDKRARWEGGELMWLKHPEKEGPGNDPFPTALPPAPETRVNTDPFLIELRDVSVSFGDRKVLDRITWKIAPGDFWELRGPNGSGKTTLLSLITGDSPKAYGQEIYLFGNRKGSGESVWDIKQHIGYITPSLTDRFRGYHTLEQMLISGLVDSIGLYTIPTEKQKDLAGSWLELLGLTESKNTYFHDLSKGQQRLVMCARAMIKHPLLLILDEPTADLDDHAAELVVHLVNKMATESHTAVLFVSHREEPELKPRGILQLNPTEAGSEGIILR